MTWDTNTAILEQLRTFSADEAWTCLAEHFEVPLTRYARRSGLSADAARDVVQEALIAFAEAYRRGAYDRDKGRLSSWLFGIARREVSAARRRRALDPVGALETGQASGLREDDDALEQVWEEEWQRAILERAIARVREEVEPATWESFALQAFDGLDVPDVMSRLGHSRTQVYNAKHRISRRLRELAGEYEDA